MLDKYPRVTVMDSGEDTGLHLAVAANPWRRIKGLLGQRFVPEDSGLFITPCSSIHCIGMSVTIDVVYVSRRDGRGVRRVLGIETVSPGRIGHSPRHTSSVLELSEGAAERHGIRVGDQLALVRVGGGYR